MYLLLPSSAPKRETPLTLGALHALYSPEAEVFLRASMVTSIDGATSVDGDSQALSSAGDRQIYRLLREQADLILLGSRTARHPGYASMKKPIAIVSNSGDVSFPEGCSGVVITSVQGARRVPSHPGVEVIPSGGDRVDLRESLTQLHERGFTGILCEGGPALLSSLHSDSLIDEICMTLSPLVAGGDSSRLLTGGSSDSSLTLRHVIADGSHLMLRYSRLGS